MNTQPVELSEVAKRTLVICSVIIGLGAVLYLIYLLHTVVLQLVAALIVSVALQPLVAFLMRRRFNRIAAVFTSILGTLCLCLVVAGMIATPLVTQGSKLIENAPEMIDQLTQNPRLNSLNQKYHLVDRAKEFSKEQSSKVVNVGVPLVSLLGSIIGGISSLVIIFIFAFFFLLEGSEAWKRLMRLFKPQTTARLNLAAEKMARAVGGFVSGNLLISLIAGTVTLITLLILDVPYAFALAALVALFDLIPLIGAAIGTIVVALVALTQGITATIIVIAVLLLYQFVEGHLIQPLVYSRVISLSPLLIILASVIGAELGGIIGVLLAIPAAAVVQIVITEFLAEMILKRVSANQDKA